MKVLWFEDQQTCVDGLAVMNDNMRALAVSYGYALSEDGSIIGKDEEGIDVPTAQVTVTWDTPHEDGATGKWFVASPSPVYPDVFADIMANVVGWTEGDYEPPIAEQMEV